jgi:hypothetical protein
MTDGRPSERGREPGNWELMRGIERLEKRFDDAVKGFVSVAVHNLLADRVKDVEADVEKARTDAAAALATIRTELDNAKKTRAQTWTAIGLLAAGGAIGLFYDIFTRGLGIGG